MSLADLWKNSKEQIYDKHLQQIITFAGDGKLTDNSIVSQEMREYLSQVPSTYLERYADECLSESFTNSGFALQDIVNQIGLRLGYDITYGRYRGSTNQIGFDGIWISPDKHGIVAEVKTTDAYRIDLNVISEYRRKLIADNQFSESNSSILIVVGRKDTGDLEAQVRGSKHAWDIRIISVDALCI